jgi:hypothetical protein
LLGALLRHKVRFVTVGGLAGRLHGAGRLTNDLDICPAWDHENLKLLADALLDLDAVLRLRPELGPAIVRPNPELLRQISITLWRTPAGNIDVLIGIPDAPGHVIGFRELEERATQLQLHDGTVLVAALEDLIRAKEVADRPKDREALPELRALLDARRPPASRNPTSEQPPPAPPGPARSSALPYPAKRPGPYRRGPTLGR